MEIEEITLHQIKMKLKTPFETSYGVYTNREFIIVEMKDQEGTVGWGECVAFSEPWYTEETIKTSWHMMEDFFIPLLFKSEIKHPSEISKVFSVFKRNNMAKAALEQAAWDLYAKQNKVSLSKLLGGTQAKIKSGVAVGLQPISELISTIEKYIEDGYQRVKLKIKPGQEYDLIKEVRQAFPDLQIMVDANSAYTFDDLEKLKALDEFNLLMIEQPLASDDIVDHRRLQQELTTPICLDESIVTYDDARKAIELSSCKVINVKMGRVGGLYEAKRIHDLCKEKGVSVWCGGMLETGIGRAHNIALASLEHFTIPGDISASSRYWEEDIINPEVVVDNGFIDVPNLPGIGYTVDYKKLEKYQEATKTFRRKV